jgi:hypothetical protein
LARTATADDRSLRFRKVYPLIIREDGILNCVDEIRLCLMCVPANWASCTCAEPSSMPVYAHGLLHLDLRKVSLLMTCATNVRSNAKRLSSGARLWRPSSTLRFTGEVSLPTWCSRRISTWQITRDGNLPYNASTMLAHGRQAFQVMWDVHQN